jgi:tetratricopeptide (TPR) repeat protein
MARAEVRAARDIGEQLFALAQKIQDISLLVEAHRTLAEVLFFLGELVLARSYFEDGAALWDLQQHQHLSVFPRGDPGIACRARVGRVLWTLGYPDQALMRSQEAVALAQKLSEPKIIAYALYDAGAVHHFRHERDALQELGEALVALAREQEFSFDLASGLVLCGLAMIEQGQGEEGAERLYQGLSALQATGAILPRTVWAAPLAEAYGRIGRTEEGLAFVNETLALTEKTGARTYEAELYRVKGELTLQLETRDWGLGAGFPAPQAPGLKPLVPSGVAQEAEECFLKAIDIAQKQQAKSLELRATVSLARLWQQQGKIAEARQILADIYNWFTEGFDTVDLKEAKALLEVLSRTGADS